MHKRILLSLLLLLGAVFTASAQNNDDLIISAQIQIRSELDGRDFSDKTHPLSFTSMRTRLGVEKSAFNKLKLFVQVQDSRVFGEEPGTLASIDNVDLHQGYALLENPFGIPVSLQAGRFEVSYGTERFLGAVGWNYVGRSWDGVRFSFNDGFKLDVFGLTQSDQQGYISAATPAVYASAGAPNQSQSLYGIWFSTVLTKMHKLDLFGYYDVNRTNSASGENILEAATLGGTHWGTYGSLSSIIEAAFQMGKASGVDLSAYLISAQLNYNTSGWNFGAGADMLSGTKAGASEVNTFIPSYGTNHKFYGYMDYFINWSTMYLPRGLNDIYLKAEYAPQNSMFSGSVYFHNFTSAQDVRIVNPATLQVSEETGYGQELDLTVKYQFVPGTSVTWGGSLFMPGELMKDLFGNDNTAFWTYLMLTASI